MCVFVCLKGGREDVYKRKVKEGNREQGRERGRGRVKGGGGGGEREKEREREREREREKREENLKELERCNFQFHNITLTRVE